MPRVREESESARCHCGARTFERKPRCLEHCEELPYAALVLDAVRRRAEEIRSGELDPDGTVVADVLVSLRGGPRTLGGMRFDTGLTIRAILLALDVLKASGRISVSEIESFRHGRAVRLFRLAS